MSKKYLFGVKYFIPYNLTTLKPLGIFEVIGGVEIGREIEQLLLTGGHNDGPYAVEAGEPSNSLTTTLKEYPNFAYSLFENADITEITSETLGLIGTLVNQVGTSIFDATTGIATATIISGQGAKIPSGFLVVEGTSDPTKVNIYLAGDVASGKTPIVSELPQIASDVTIPGTGGTLDLTDYGITLTGGSGSVAFVEDDIMVFDVRPANTQTDKIQVGKNASVNYFGVLLVYPRNSQKQQTIVRFPNVAAIGMSFNANTREFSEFEQAMTPMLSADEDILYEIIRTQIA